MLLSVPVRGYAAGAAEHDWEHPRGPSFTGVADSGFDMPAEPRPAVLWKAFVGEGFSGCVLSKGRLFTQAQTPAGQFVIALEAKNGREIWRRRIEWAWEPGAQYPGPFATPVVHDGRVYFAGAYGTVGCLDAASGRTIWKVDLVGDHGIERPGFGYACTPLILDTAVLVFGGERGPSLLALDAHTGRLQWQQMTERYRRFRRARARLVKLFAQILKLVDELERERTVPPPP